MRSLKGTLVFKVDPDHPDKKTITDSAKAIRDGRLVAFPTETVYGLAASLLKEGAIKKLYEVKARPRNKPFTVHIADLDTIREMGCGITGRARKLIERFWPGPLTIVLKSKKGARIGFRMPANKVALELIKSSRVPMVAPSANLSGSPAPRDAGSVLKELGGKIDIIIDAGPTDIGVESTVADLSVDPPVILREGAIRNKEIFDVINSKF